MHRWLVSVLIIICLLVWQTGIFAAAREWAAEEKLSKLAKPAVVRVVSLYLGTWTVGSVRLTTYYGNFGSGAFIHPDGYIVTNAHVVASYNLTERQQWEKLALGLEKFLVSKGLTPLQASFVIKSGQARLEKVEKVFVVITPGGEELPYDVKEIGSAGGMDGKDVAVIKVEGRNYPTLRLGDSDKVRTGERIFVAGYPGDADLGKWGSQKSSLEWSWAPGTVSSDRKASSQGTPLIQVNAEGVKPGSSGGPILNADGEVVGLMTFGTAGGPHWAVVSRTVQEFVRKAGIANEVGFTDRAYREGLEFYWQGYYSKALAKFEEVRRLYPKHSEADALIADCQNSISQGNDRRYWPDYYPYFGAAAVLLLVAIGTACYLRRRRKAAERENEMQG